MQPSRVKSVSRVGGWRWESKLVHTRNKILEDFSTLYVYNDSNNCMPDTWKRAIAFTMMICLTDDIHFHE